MRIETQERARKSAREGKLLYHLTALENLPGVLQQGLLSRAELRERGLTYGDVADPAILEKRAISGLDRMIPFHFMSRNPFDYAVVRTWPARRFVIVSVWRTFAATNDWKIIPKHPLTADGELEILDWKTGYESIEWAEMDKFPRNYDNDHRCKMTCMAEGLSPHPVRPEHWAYLYVSSDRSRAEVQELVGASLEISVNANMFPQGCL